MSLANKAQLQKRKRVLNKKNSSHQVSHLFPFPSHNESVFFISNVNLLPNEQKPSNDRAENMPKMEDIINTQNINLGDIRVESRVFPVLTKTNGFPRLIQEVKINLGAHILTLTNMTTNLKPSALSDEYFSQIVSTLSPPNVINEYKLEETEDRCPLGDRADGQLGFKKEATLQDTLEIEEKTNNESMAKEANDDEDGGMKKELFAVKKKIQKQKGNTV